MRKAQVSPTPIITFTVYGFIAMVSVGLVLPVVYDEYIKEWDYVTVKEVVSVSSGGWGSPTTCVVDTYNHGRLVLTGTQCHNIKQGYIARYSP